jgi:Uma2 family endonuclease
MAMPAVKRRWTAREVRQLVAESPLATPRYELVHGVAGDAVAKLDAPVGGDAAPLSLIEYLKRQPLGDASTSPFDVELAPESIVQPDVFVVPAHEARRLVTEMPARELLVAAEVLSPSSGRHDRVTKRPHYQRHVPEYWMHQP